MSNLYRQLLGNLLFDHSDKFQAYNSSVCQKVKSSILEKEFCIEMGIFPQFKRLFMTSLIFLLLFIHVQHSKHWYKQPQQRTLVASI